MSLSLSLFGPGDGDWEIGEQPVAPDAEISEKDFRGCVGCVVGSDPTEAGRSMMGTGVLARDAEVAPRTLKKKLKP